MGNGARGLQRQRRRLELLHPRPGALARLPLGRGRPGRHQRRPPGAVLRAGAVERARPDPQGARLRPGQQRGQPRRGREGVLLLPRLDADALVHEVPVQVSAGGLSRTTTSSRPTAAAASTSPSTSCSTPACSTTTATSTSSSNTPRRRPTTCWCESASATAARMRRRCTCCRRCGFATPGRSRAAARSRALEQVDVRRPCGGARPSQPIRCSRNRWRLLPVLRRRRAAAVHRERNQQRAAVRLGTMPRPT